MNARTLKPRRGTVPPPPPARERVPHVFTVEATTPNGPRVGHTEIHYIDEPRKVAS